jgi:hypothetical protein
MWLNRDEINKICNETNREDSYYQNCGGYALGIDSWYQLGPDVNWFNEGLSRCSRKGGWREFERSCVRYILKDNPELKLVDNKLIDEVAIDLDKIEIIAFRISRQFFGSYHFMRCDQNGDWLEKRGHYSHIHRHRYEEIHDIWGEYNGREFFFVRKRA